jgi:hypothetical protein
VALLLRSVVRCEKKSVSCPCRENTKDWFAGGKEEVFFFVENCLSLRTITQPRRRRGKKAGGKGRKESLSFLQVFVFLLLCLGFLSLPPIAFLHAYDKEQECFDLGETAVRYE